MHKAPLSGRGACNPRVLHPPTHLLLHTFAACSISILLGARGAQGSNTNTSCFLLNSTNFVQVTASSINKTVQLEHDRGDIETQLCRLCNCSSPPCSCSQVSSDLSWVTTHPLQHLLLLLTILLPNQFHLRRPWKAHVTSAATAS
ncbi:GP3 protein [Mikumi yellow baboon virus 1]|uniref:GP3 protein n=1 Tax=Mikumi yellow baboon virus 1 TaxID=1546177 RepID=A0A089FY93_9NIDO|nr:GP3 protein [Mikumi yellow baboon virus 1]AIP91226.1 GP3 protein [Mikumi yellow baboon virus 1]